MEKFIPYEKLSKKKQRERNVQRRGSWNGLNPVTRKPANPKAYNRQKARNRRCDSDSVPFCLGQHPCAHASAGTSANAATRAAM